jgi:hypothetical protein
MVLVGIELELHCWVTDRWYKVNNKIVVKYIILLFILVIFIVLAIFNNYLFIYFHW